MISHEYTPFGADFQKSAELFTEGVEFLDRCWNEQGVFSFKGEFYTAEDIEVLPRPLQKPFRPYMASFSRFRWSLLPNLIGIYLRTFRLNNPLR